MAYLVICFIAAVIDDSVIAVFLENSENDLKLKEWINFGIYTVLEKITFAFSALALTPLALLTCMCEPVILSTTPLVLSAMKKLWILRQQLQQSLLLLLLLLLSLSRQTTNSDIFFTF